MQRPNAQSMTPMPRTTFQTVITESWMTENPAMLSVGAWRRRV